MSTTLYYTNCESLVANTNLEFYFILKKGIFYLDISSDLVKKDNECVFKILTPINEFLALNNIFIVFFDTNQMLMKYTFYIRQIKTYFNSRYKDMKFY